MSEIIQVRNVPKKVHTELVRQAKNAGLSLNKYLLGEFEKMARRGHNAEVLRRAHAVLGDLPEMVDTVEAIREAREERERELDDRLRRIPPR